MADIHSTPPFMSYSLQCVVLELRGDGVPHRPPGRPESPEHDLGPRASPSVHSGTLQGVCTGHYPDGQSEEVSAGREGCWGGAVTPEGWGGVDRWSSLV